MIQQKMTPRVAVATPRRSRRRWRGAPHVAGSPPANSPRRSRRAAYAALLTMMWIEIFARATPHTTGNPRRRGLNEAQGAAARQGRRDEPTGPFPARGDRGADPFSRRRLRILRPGSFVRCAVTGEPIPLDELRYWSVDLQEAYSSPKAALARLERRGERATGAATAQSTQSIDGK